MKTNIRIETTDEEREAIATTLQLSDKLAKRKDIRDAVDNYIKELINGRIPTTNDEGGHRGDQLDDRPAGDQGLPDHDDPIANFRPSRGDEPYLYKPRSVALKDACSAMLDQAELIEQLVWDVLEKNRADN